MDLRPLRRPACDLLSGRSQYLFAANLPARRHESSYRRTKKRLNVKPDASFGFSKSSPNQDTIVFNPPSSAPSVLHTPLKFLPKDDPRRGLYSSTNSTLAPFDGRLPPLVQKPQPGFQRHHLSEQDVAEIRRLRIEDPDHWTRVRLARKFNCSSIFIAICAETPAEQVAKDQAKLAAIKARWGPKRIKAREDRERRREAVYRDE
jgi:hypothetical protein